MKPEPFDSMPSLRRALLAWSIALLPMVVLAQKQAPEDKPTPSNPTSPLTKQQEEQNKLQKDADQKIKALADKLDKTRRTDARMRLDELGAICKRELPPEVYGKLSAGVLDQCVKALKYEFHQCSPISKKSICNELR
jgi:hypothetical protein